MLLEHALPVDDNDDVCQSAAVAKQYTIVMRSVKENTGVCIEHNVGQIVRYQSAQRAFTITCRTVAVVVFLLLSACPRRSFADVFPELEAEPFTETLSKDAPWLRNSTLLVPHSHPHTRSLTPFVYLNPFAERSFTPAAFRIFKHIADRARGPRYPSGPFFLLLHLALGEHNRFPDPFGAYLQS